MSSSQLQSMTGYGASAFSVGARRYEVELKSVNHRFLDLRFHLPRGFLSFEDELTRQVKARLSRGHLEISVRSLTGDEIAAGFSVDLAAARVTLESLRAVQAALDLPDAPTLALLSGFREIFIPREVRPDEAALRLSLFSAFEEALARLCEMRAAEGAALTQEFNARLAATRAVVTELEARAPAALQQRQQRVSARVEALLVEAGRTAQVEGLAERLAVELAVLAERADITEELARLHAHLGQVSDALGAGGPQGKRLDFLVQELHREANTVGSKSQDPELGRLVVSLKAEVERLREQAQNVE